MIGIAFTLPDSAARYAYVILGLLTVPLSFFWSVFTFIIAENKNSKRLSLMVLSLSGAMLFIGLLKVF